MRCIELVGTQLRREVSLSGFFAAPTIRRLAEHLRSAEVEVEEGSI
jgi:hypothetical protein